MDSNRTFSARDSSRTGIANLISEIRSRWQRRTTIRGALLVLVVLLLLTTVLLLSIALFDIGRTQALFGIGTVLAMTLLVGYRYIVSPLRNQPSDEQLALFVEEKMPGLQDALNSAVELDAGGRQAVDSVVIEKLLKDAFERSRAVSPATIVDRQRERFLMYTVAALVLAFLVFGYTIRDRIDLSSGRVELASLRPEPAISIVPRNGEVEKGATQEVIVRFREDVERDVYLVWREGSGEWIRNDMIKGATGQSVYLSEITDIQEPVEYFIQYGDERTELFALSLYQFPAVEDISVTYRYPAYTGLGSTTDEGTGNIRALRGTVVEVLVETSGEVVEGELVTGEGPAVELESGGPFEYSASLEVQDDGWYHVRLVDTDGRENRFPAEYRIEVTEDLAPVVRFVEPGRDVRVNAVEEVLLSVEASDDLGLRDVHLRYSVNAQDEKSVSLASGLGRSSREADGEHMIFLEDYSLQPGDVISYYAEVRDHLDREAPVATDMYFIEVIPFDTEYQQANNAGGNMQQRSSGVVLSQQQIITATWKLFREWPDLSNDEASSSLNALVQAQSNLKSNIEQRISSTAFSLELQSSAEQQQLVEYLRAATVEMEEAIRILDDGNLREAITPERRALNNLLRADAMNNEQQVSMNRNGQSGGGGAVQDRISELMDLELDISKDKYETQQQRPSGGASGQEVDEALEKVRDLARKQEEVEERSRQNNTEGEDRKRFVEQLKRDQDDLQQQTEQLTESLRRMQEGTPSGRRREQSAERISENMDRAEQALREGNVEEAMRYQRRALNELEDLQRSLESESARSTRGRVQELARDFDRFREQEMRLSDDIDRVLEDARAGQLDNPQEALDALSEKRQQMIDNLKDLESAAGDLAEDIRDEQPEMYTALRNVLQQIRRDRLEENMRDSGEAIAQGWLDYADRKEEPILRTIEDIETQRRVLDYSMSPSDEEQAVRSLSDARDLRDQLEEIQRLAQEQGEQQGEGQGGQSGQPRDREQRAAEARLENQIERAQQTLDRLQQGMNNNPEAQRQLRQLESFLADAQGTGTRLEGEAAEAYFNDRAYAPLSSLESDLIEQLDQLALEEKLHVARRPDVPARYRDLVEKYYESLSKENN